MGEADRAEAFLVEALTGDKNELLANALYGKILVTKNKLSEAKSYLEDRDRRRLDRSLGLL